MAKRSASEGSSGTPAKRPSLLGVDIGPVSGQDELDLKVLQVQNRKLSERIKERNYSMEQLRDEVVHLKTAQSDCQQKLLILRQFWDTIDTQILSGLSSLGVTHDSGAEREEFTKQLLTLSSGQLRTRGQEKCAQSKANVVALFKHVEKEIDKVKNLSTDSNLSQALEVEIAVWRKRNEKKTQSMINSSDSLKDTNTLLEEKVSRLEGSLADAKFDLQKYQTKADRLEHQLADVLRDLHSQPHPPDMVQASHDQTNTAIPSVNNNTTTTTTTTVVENVSAATTIPSSGEPPKSEVNDGIQLELGELKDVVENRLKEIEDLHRQLADSKAEVERLKLDAGNIAEADVKASSVFKALQSHFSVVFAENSQQRAHLEETKRLLVASKQQHMAQVEEIMAEHRKYQSEVREEVLQLEEALSSMRRQYDLVRMEFEKNLASNEQAVPINKELRQMIASLEHTIHQQKVETQHYKQQAQQANDRMLKLQAECTAEREREIAIVEQESKEVEDLKEHINKLENEKHNMEILLDVYKGVPKEQRDRAQVVASERRYKEEIELLKAKVVQQKKEFDRKRDHLKDDMSRKQKQVLDDNKQLQNSLASKKEEVEALMSEIEVTAQAYEDVQELNKRLLEQLKEKEDANIKLMSERIKSNSVQQLLTEEKDLVTAHLTSVQQESDSLRDVIRKMEEREQSLEATIASGDRELSLSQQAMELHKKKAFDSAQSAHELTLRNSELESHLKQHAGVINNKVEQLEGMENKLQRAVEEVSTLKKRIDKYRNRESASIADEVLLEEIKTYKTKLNCPCCGSRKKDTVLTKCFHVFCAECIRTRYETRQRKCPKCNAAFGTNDFHKIYLS